MQVSLTVCWETTTTTRLTRQEERATESFERLKKTEAVPLFPEREDGERRLREEDSLRLLFCQCLLLHDRSCALFPVVSLLCLEILDSRTNLWQRRTTKKKGGYCMLFSDFSDFSVWETEWVCLKQLTFDVAVMYVVLFSLFLLVSQSLSLEKKSERMTFFFFRSFSLFFAVFFPFFGKGMLSCSLVFVTTRHVYLCLKRLFLPKSSFIRVEFHWKWSFNDCLSIPFNGLRWDCKERFLALILHQVSCHDCQHWCSCDESDADAPFLLDTWFCYEVSPSFLHDSLHASFDIGWQNGRRFLYHVLGYSSLWWSVFSGWSLDRVCVLHLLCLVESPCRSDDVLDEA